MKKKRRKKKKRATTKNILLKFFPDIYLWKWMNTQVRWFSFPFILFWRHFPRWCCLQASKPGIKGFNAFNIGMNKKINSLSSIIIRSFSIMNFITIHINDTIKYSVQYLASCTCLSADMLIYHICDILHHLPLSLMLPSLLQYPLRMVAPPSPPFSPEHHNCCSISKVWSVLHSLGLK